MASVHLPSGDLVGASEALNRVPGDLQHVHIQEFLRSYSVTEIYQALSSDKLGESAISNVTSALTRILQSPDGEILLPQLQPYLTSGLDSRHAAVRRFSASHLGRLLGHVPPGGDGIAMMTQVLGTLEDEDTGVAFAGEGALVEYCTSHGEAFQQLLTDTSEAGRKLSGLLQPSQRSTVRLRAMSLVMRVGARSSESSLALQMSGTLDTILKELDREGDPLACLAVVTMMRDLAGDGGVGSLGTMLLPHLVPLLADPLLRSGILPLAAEIAGGALSEETTSPEANGTPQFHPLLQQMADILDEQGTESSEAEVMVLDTAGRFGLSSRGARVLVGDSAPIIEGIAERAVGRAPNPEVRLAALHAIANVAGVERALETKDREAALLRPELEDRLRVALYSSAASTSGAPSPAEVMYGYLQQPFPAQHIACYRCLTALALRPWCAADICSHLALLTFLCDPASERGKATCEWRYACVTALWSCAQDLQDPGLVAPKAQVDMIQPHLPKIEAAVKAGPFGSGTTGTTAPHLVATMNR